MKAVDTNVIARYVIQDNVAQHEIAARILAEPCYIPITVLLELGWLLSSRYRMTRAATAETLADIVALPTVSVDNPADIDWAIDRYRAGADIADMLHLVTSRRADAFVTFDKDIAAAAGPTSPVTVETLV